MYRLIPLGPPLPTRTISHTRDLTAQPCRLFQITSSSTSVQGSSCAGLWKVNGNSRGVFKSPPSLTHSDTVKGLYTALMEQRDETAVSYKRCNCIFFWNTFLAYNWNVGQMQPSKIIVYDQRHNQPLILHSIDQWVGDVSSYISKRTERKQTPQVLSPTSMFISIRALYLAAGPVLVTWVIRVSDLSSNSWILMLSVCVHEAETLSLSHCHIKKQVNHTTKLKHFRNANGNKCWPKYACQDLFFYFSQIWCVHICTTRNNNNNNTNKKDQSHFLVHFTGAGTHTVDTEL